MTKSKKSEDKSKDSASLQISVEDFVRTRDSVVTGLATLQSAVQDLSRAYIAHTNTVLGKGSGAPVELLSFNSLGGETLFNRNATPAPAADPAEKSKKRKRAPHDKNAPKRPVTPYFLYMQTARPLIAGEMPHGSAKQVAEEGTRRWANMPGDEKHRWSYKYGVNYTRYKEKASAYKEGRPIPEISDAEAKKMYDDQIKSGKVKMEIPLAADEEEVHEDDGEGAESSDDSASSSSSEEAPEPEPVKEPSPPKSSRASKRQKGVSSEKKSSPVKKAAAEETVGASSPIVAPASKLPEPEKKKKGSKKKEVPEPKPEPVVAPVSSPPKLTSQDSQQKSKKARKKRKSEAIEE